MLVLFMSTPNGHKLDMIKWVKFGPVKLLHIYVALCSVNTIGLYLLYITACSRGVIATAIYLSQLVG